MPCFFNDATCNALHTGNGWQNGGGSDICSVHYAQRVADIRGGQTMSDALVNDYLKIDLLMRDTGAVLTELGKLNAAMSGPALAALQDPKRGNYVKLSAALTFYESKCWFPDTHLILIGLLPAADFLRVLGHGYMAKDVGAGANHGEFSHRLQWHAIMRRVTGDFVGAKAAGWNNSVYDLYCSFGEGPALARGLWGSLLDNQGAADCRNPSYLDAQIRNSGLAVLKTKLDSVRTKRIALTNTASTFAAQQADRETRNPVTQQRPQQKAFVKLGDNYLSQVVGPAYASHKGINVSGMTVESKVADVRAENPDLQATSFFPTQALPATPAVEVLKELHLYEKPKWWKPSKFSLCMANGALMRSGERLLTDREVHDRRLRSRTKLHD
jgi:hypothetical protein